MAAERAWPGISFERTNHGLIAQPAVCSVASPNEPSSILFDERSFAVFGFAVFILPFFGFERRALDLFFVKPDLFVACLGITVTFALDPP